MARISSHDKGKRGEREFAALARQHGFADARRGQQFSGSPDSPDVCIDCGVHFEVKRTEKLRLLEAWRQVTGDCGERKPAVAWKRNHGEWLVLCRADDFLDMLATVEGVKL